MNLHELFRSFMGIPPPRDPSFGDPVYEDNGGFGRNVDPYEGSMFSAPWDMFRHLDGIFRSFGLTELPPFLHGPDMPALEGPNEPGHLRDHMLKVPDYREPFRRSQDMWPNLSPGHIQTEDLPYKDFDLDEHVARIGLDSLLAPTEPQAWMGGMSSVQNSRKIEERTVVRDAHGNEEVTVRRSLGDRSMTVRTIKRPDGLTETQEQYVNMDEGDKAAFEEMWHGSSGNKASDGPIFRKLFDFFPPNRP